MALERRKKRLKAAALSGLLAGIIALAQSLTAEPSLAETPLISFEPVFRLQGALAGEVELDGQRLSPDPAGQTGLMILLRPGRNRIVLREGDRKQVFEVIHLLAPRDLVMPPGQIPGLVYLASLGLLPPDAGGQIHPRAAIRLGEACRVLALGLEPETYARDADCVRMLAGQGWLAGLPPLDPESTLSGDTLLSLMGARFGPEARLELPFPWPAGAISRETFGQLFVQLPSGRERISRLLAAE